MGNGDKKIEQAPVLKEDDKVQLEQLAKDAEKKNFDTSADMNQIKTNIDDIKKSVVDLKKDMEDLEKNKSTFTKEIADTREKEIEVKKAEIELKKKETQELIAKIRKERVDLKLETLDDVTKALLTEQKAKDEAALFQYEKDLQAIQPEKKGFREKIKSGASRAREWAKEHPVPTAGIAVGATLLIGWIGGWFKSKDEYEEDENGHKKRKKKKGFWNHGVGKFLKYAGIGVAGFFGIKWLIKQFGNSEEAKHEGNDTEIPGTLRDTKNAVESFENIKEPQTKEALNAVGTEVNNFYDYVYKFDDGTIPLELMSERLGAGKDTYAGVIPHILDNTFGNISKIESETGLFMVGAYGDYAEIAKKFAGILGKGLVTPASRLVNSTLGMIGCPSVIGEATEEAMITKIQQFLTGKNNLEEVHLLYRKIFKTMSYLNYAENAFLGKKIETLLSGGAVLYEKSGEYWDVYEYDKDPEAIKRLVKKISDGPDEFKIGDVTVESMKIDDFRNKKIRDVAAMGMTTDVVLQYSPEIKEDVDDLDKKRKEKLRLLDKDPNEALDKMTEMAEGEMGDSFYKSLTKIIPPVQLLGILNVGTEGEVKQKIMEKGGFKDLLDSYKGEFQKMKGQDKGKIKAMIDKYYAQLKEITVTTAGIYESQDENGNRLLHAGISVVNVFTGLVMAPFTGISMIVEGVGDITHGKPGEGMGETVGGGILASQGVGFLGRFIGGKIFKSSFCKKYGLKLTFWPVRIPAKLVWGVTVPYAKVGAAELNNARITSKLLKLYKTPEAIRGGILHGMSSETAFKLFQMQSQATAGTETRFLKEVLLMEFESPAQKLEMQMMEDLLEGKRFGTISRIVSTEGRLIMGTKKPSLQVGLDAMMPIYTKILKGGTKNVQAAGYKLLERLPIKEWAKAEKLLSNPDIIAELNKIKNVDDIPAMTKALAKSLKTTDDVDAAIETFKNIIRSGIVTNAPAEIVEEVIEEGLKSKAAGKIFQLRDGKMDEFMKQFEKGGKYEKYAAEYRGLYENAKNDEIALKNLDWELAEKNLKDGKNLDELLDFQPHQKAVYDFVKADVKEMETTIAGLPKKAGNTKAMEVAYKTKIEKMKVFERKLGELGTDQAESFIKLREIKVKFKTYHIIELLDLMENEGKVAGKLTENGKLTKILGKESPTFAEIAQALTLQRKAGIQISDDLMKTVDNIRLGILGKSFTEMGKILGTVLKFVGRFLRIIPK